MGKHNSRPMSESYLLIAFQSTASAADGQSSLCLGSPGHSKCGFASRSVWPLTPINVGFLYIELITWLWFFSSAYTNPMLQPIQWWVINSKNQFYFCSCTLYVFYDTWPWWCFKMSRKYQSRPFHLWKNKLRWNTSQESFQERKQKTGCLFRASCICLFLWVFALVPA